MHLLDRYSRTVPNCTVRTWGSVQNHFFPSSIIACLFWVFSRVFPTRVRKTVDCPVLVRQVRFHWRHYSVWEPVRRYQFTSNTHMHRQVFLRLLSYLHKFTGAWCREVRSQALQWSYLIPKHKFVVVLQHKEQRNWKTVCRHFVRNSWLCERALLPPKNSRNISLV